MTEKFKILGQYIKDLSSETKDAETYVFVKDQISKYQLKIDITSKIIALLKRLTYKANIRINIKVVVKYNFGSRDFISQNRIMPKPKGKPIK